MADRKTLMFPPRRRACACGLFPCLVPCVRSCQNQRVSWCSSSGSCSTSGPFPGNLRQLRRAPSHSQYLVAKPARERARASCRPLNCEALLFTGSTAPKNDAIHPRIQEEPSPTMAQPTAMRVPHRCVAVRIRGRRFCNCA